VQANLSKKQDCFSEIAQNGVMAQVAEHLPSKCEALSSNSSPAKKKKMKEICHRVNKESELGANGSHL
jgi:hypothetical protein